MKPRAPWVLLIHSEEAETLMRYLNDLFSFIKLLLLLAAIYLIAYVIYVS